MKFTKTSLENNFLIDLEPNVDKRGFFARYFCKNEFELHKLNSIWVQINNSFCEDAGTLRGLHYQTSHAAEVKLVRCIKGAIWDVVVDLRKNSKTFGKWFGKNLSDKNRTMMYVPKGFAHGFVSLEQKTEIIYLVSNFYAPDKEKTLYWDDKTVNIEWPIKPSVISEKDKIGELLKNITPVIL